MIINRKFTGKLVKELETRGLEGQWTSDVADNIFSLFARPNLKSVPLSVYYCPLSVQTDLASWRKCWWVRLLRWVYFKLVPYRLHDRLMPHWLIELIRARHIHVNYTLEKLPEDVLERIQVMRHYLLQHKIKPTKVLMGQRALFDLKSGSVSGYGDYWVENLVSGNFDTIFGLEIQVSPFLAEDAVIVC